MAAPSLIMLSSRDNEPRRVLQMKSAGSNGLCRGRCGAVSHDPPCARADSVGDRGAKTDLQELRGDCRCRGGSVGSSFNAPHLCMVTQPVSPGPTRLHEDRANLVLHPERVPARQDTGQPGRTRACGGVARLLAPCPSRKTTVNYARSTALCLTITEASDQVPWPFAYFLSYCAKYIARRRREERKDVVPRRGRPADCGWSTCSPHLQHVVPYTGGPDASSGAKVPYATLAASQIHATGDAASAH